MKARGIKDFKQKVLSTQDLKDDLIKDPIGFINRLEAPPFWNKGPFITIVIIVGLALIFSIGIAAIVVLQPGTVVNNPNGDPILLKQEVDNFFVMIGSTALGALTGMLVPNPKG